MAAASVVCLDEIRDAPLQDLEVALISETALDSEESDAVQPLLFAIDETEYLTSDTEPIDRSVYTVAKISEEPVISFDCVQVP